MKIEHMLRFFLLLIATLFFFVLTVIAFDSCSALPTATQTQAGDLQ
jgi:hypothetical protein